MHITVYQICPKYYRGFHIEGVIGEPSISVRIKYSPPLSFSSPHFLKRIIKKKKRTHKKMIKDNTK